MNRDRIKGQWSQIEGGRAKDGASAATTTWTAWPARATHWPVRDAGCACATARTAGGFSSRIGHHDLEQRSADECRKPYQ